MEHRFDLFTKSMAQEMPRRGALKRIGAGLAAAFVAASGAAETVLAKPGGNADCAHWCHDNFQGSDAGHCTADAAHGEGVCYQCGPAAPAGSTAILCNGVCVPSDVKNCGTCGNVCTAPANATATCTNGKCGFTCNSGFLLCGGACVPNDVKNCGTCGNVCTAPANGTATCTNGKCDFTCNAGFTRCGNACVNEQSDLNNCGVCGTVCPTPANGTAVCSAGKCAEVCNAGFADCDGNFANGCETNLLNDPKNCGACGHVCSAANGTAACQNGTCVVVACNAGFADCNGNPADGCETNTLTDVNNCGACGNHCVAPANGAAVCAAGQCSFTCNPGFTRCGNTCINIQSDVNNCGTCGHVCASGQTCTAGVCKSTTPQVCTTGTDPETGNTYIVCRADATTAWISADTGGYYHTDQICQSLGYHAMGQYGGTCGNVCGYCQGTTSCTSPGNEHYDGQGTCGTDAFGRIICYTVTWQCV